MLSISFFREERSARVLLGVVIAFTLANSAVSVGFSYLGRDFWTALSQKDSEHYFTLLGKYALALLGGVPVSVLYSYYRQKLALEWRSWMAQRTIDMFESYRR